MATYQYKARDRFSKLIQGNMLADSSQAVAVKLKEMGYFPVVIEELDGQRRLDISFNFWQGVSFTDLNMFTRQLYTLQKAGLPLLSSLQALKQQSVNPVFSKIIEQMIHDLEAGSSLSEALAQHPQVFNSIYVNMIKSGEVGGRLVDVLDRLVTIGEHDEKIRLRIRAAMRYPIIVVVAICLAFMVLITLVVPRFAALYSQFNTELPLPTRVLIGINYVVEHFWWLILFIGGAVFVILNQLIKTPPGRLFWDHLKLKMPVFGPLVLKLNMSRFGRLTGMLMRSGVPILQILDLVSSGLGNVVISNAITKIKESVNEGKGMLDPAKQSGLFPPVVIQMIATGEETGKLDELLIHVSDYYDSEIDYTVSNLVAYIEPLLVVVLGTTILGMALGIFLPMWNMMNLFK